MSSHWKHVKLALKCTSTGFLAVGSGFLAVGFFNITGCRLAVGLPLLAGFLQLGVWLYDCICNSACKAASPCTAAVPCTGCNGETRCRHSNLPSVSFEFSRVFLCPFRIFLFCFQPHFLKIDSYLCKNHRNRNIDRFSCSCSFIIEKLL